MKSYVQYRKIAMIGVQTPKTMPTMAPVEAMSMFEVK